MRAFVGAAVALMLMSGPAFAHPPPLGIGGFFGGVIHPLFVPAHTLAILGLGLLIGQNATTPAAWSRMVALCFIASLALGLAVMTRGFVPILMGEAVLLLALGCGLLVALARPLPETAGFALAGIAGLCIALDSPPEVISVREANFMLIGTGFGATLLMIVAVEIATRLTAPWARIASRVLGSWVAASAILTLATRLV